MFELKVILFVNAYRWNLKKKMVQVNLFAGQGQRHRYREWTCGHEEGMNWKIGLTYIHYHV